MEKPSRNLVLNDAAFVLRCSCGAVISYLLAVSIGLEHPVWAAVSSLIVAQDGEKATDKAAMARVIGTCAGVAISAVIGSIPILASAPIAVDMGLSVALCAIVTLRFPSMRVAMWTAPLVYLSQAPGTDLWHSGLWRGLEVLFGAAIGAGLHWVVARALRALE